MKKRKILLLVLALLLVSAGWVAAQSSANYNVRRTVLVGGGAANSASYRVNAVIGQAASGSGDSANYDVTAGFLFPRGPVVRLWLPVMHR
jgi:hypothetical protein